MKANERKAILSAIETLADAVNELANYQSDGSRLQDYRRDRIGVQLHEAIWQLRQDIRPSHKPPQTR